MISAAVVILTAGYILWAIQRVYLGAEYKGPHREALTPMTLREFSIAAPLLALAIFFGVNPNGLLNYMQPSVDQDGRRTDRLDQEERTARHSPKQATAETADQDQQTNS